MTYNVFGGTLNLAQPSPILSLHVTRITGCLCIRLFGCNKIRPITNNNLDQHVLSTSNMPQTINITHNCSVKRYGISDISNLVDVKKSPGS